MKINFPHRDNQLHLDWKNESFETVTSGRLCANWKTVQKNFHNMVTVSALLPEIAFETWSTSRTVVNASFRIRSYS